MTKKQLKVIVANDTTPTPYIKFLNSIYQTEVIVISHAEMNEQFDKGMNVDVDLVLFTGGEDVNPILYGENVGKHTHYNHKRDLTENHIYNIFRNKNVLKLGICRGSQFLTVMNGGKLIQHVEGHAQGPHQIMDLKTGKYEITSTHHQMMYPYNLPKTHYELIAFSTYFKSNTYLNGENKEIEIPKDFLECEIVYYPNSNSLAIQGHPETMSVQSSGRNACLQHIRKYLK
jgi:anthranilate/para-aminobenzoate synthase component II